MEKQHNEIEFRNQTIYIGLDVHKQTWSANMRSSGIELKAYRLDPRPEDLSKYLKRTYPGARYKSVYEAGFCGFSVHRKLVKLGIENIVVNPADVPTMGKEKAQKTDPRDARKLARELEGGNLEAIYILTESEESVRSLSRLRKQSTKDMVREKNRIKSQINRLGIELPPNSQMKHWSRGFIEYLRELPFSQPTDKLVMENMISAMIQKRELIAQIVRELRKIVNDDEQLGKTVKLLMTIPGIGFITAITLATEIVDIKRFKHLDQLCCFIGLIPSVSSSADRMTVNGITQRHMRYLRNMIIESSWTAIKYDPALLLYYNELCKKQHKQPQKVIIRVAKKLLNRVMTVWSKQTPYVCSVVK